MTLTAITRAVSQSLADCELTHLSREPIDIGRAERQHAAYEGALRNLGVTVVRAEAAPDLPDAVFVEDLAIVLDEVAVLTHPGASSRRAESPGIEEALARYRRCIRIVPPGTLDGGDVLRLDRTLYVGRSGRTNQHGIDQLQRLLAPFDYQVVAVDFEGCLHLKSAVTQLADDLLLLNPSWVSVARFPGNEAIEIDPGEHHAANALRIGDYLIFPSEYVRTRQRIDATGLRVVGVDCGELAKAEGAVTCCSLIFHNTG